MDAPHTPGPWRVRSHPNLGSFVEAQRPGKPYGQEILGDDYDYDGCPEGRKLADCERVVACVNAFAGMTLAEVAAFAALSELDKRRAVGTMVA